MKQIQKNEFVETFVRFGSLIISFNVSCPQAIDEEFTRAWSRISTRWRHLDLVLQRIQDDILMLRKARRGALQPSEVGLLLAAPSLDIESFFVVVRSLLEDVAVLTPCFYPKAQKKPKRISFSDQIKWFKKHPDFDPVMTKFIDENLDWFDNLKATRDDLLHRHADVLPINSAPETAQGNISVQFEIIGATGLKIGASELEVELRSILGNLVNFLSFYSLHFKTRLTLDWPDYKDIGGPSPKGGVQGLEVLKQWLDSKRE